MACFTLTGDQRRLLADCIAIGLGGAEVSDADLEAFDALQSELEAAETPIEITVAAIEDGDHEIDMDGNRVGYEELTGTSSD